MSTITNEARKDQPFLYFKTKKKNWENSGIKSENTRSKKKPTNKRNIDFFLLLLLKFNKKQSIENSTLHLLLVAEGKIV